MQEAKYPQERRCEPMERNKELFKGVLLVPTVVFILVPAIILRISGNIRWFCGKTFPESMFVVACPNRQFMIARI
jgi:hypothetical protein